MCGCPAGATVELVEGVFVVGDDATGAYGEGDSREAAVAAYRETLAGLRRVLSARRGTLSPGLTRCLAVLEEVFG